jgi:hypothetical protein
MTVERRKPAVLCPRCGTPVPWDASSPYRPFCSERCRLVDLGKWATEEYRVAENFAAAPPDSPGDPQ